MVFESKKSIEDVFTPRNQSVNNSMYISRPELEEYLARAIKKRSHSLIFGESGNGKSWLYKQVLFKTSTPYKVANCANASRLTSITKEIYSTIIGSGKSIKTGYEEGKVASVKAVVAEGELSHTNSYALSQNEPLLEAFKEFDREHPGKKIVVLDNLESIFNSQSLMDELADIIILLDDERYSQYNINFLIVGVPNGVLEYFSKTKNMESVANRLIEIPKVGSLDETQVKELVERGFKQLGHTFTKPLLESISRHIFNITLGIAQRVHEYCEELAYVLKNNEWKYEDDLIDTANTAWLKQGLRQSYSVIESHLNSRETTVARRNQVIFSIGKLKGHKFDSSEIDKLIRKEFPDTIPSTNMGIGSILSELASTNNPLLKRNESTGDYSVVDPRYISCIRLVFIKDKVTNKLTLKPFKI